MPRRPHPLDAERDRLDWRENHMDADAPDTSYFDLFVIGFYRLLAALLLCALGGWLLFGCASSIRGGTALRTDERTVTAPGETRTDAHTVTNATGGQSQRTERTAVVRVFSDGSVEVRTGNAAAATQPVTVTTDTTTAATTRPTVATEVTRATTATTQPSASSPTGLPKFSFNGAGDVSSIGFDIDAAAETLKARALFIGPLVLGALAFFLFKRWLAGGVCLACAAVVALVSQWMVDAVFGVGIAAGVGFLIYEIAVKHKSIQDLKNLVTPTPKPADAAPDPAKMIP